MVRRVLFALCVLILGAASVSARGIEGGSVPTFTFNARSTSPGTVIELPRVVIYEDAPDYPRPAGPPKFRSDTDARTNDLSLEGYCTFEISGDRRSLRMTAERVANRR